MKYRILLLLVLFLACGLQRPEEMKGFLSGYWEIEKVKLPDGSEKIFTVNTTVDYMEVNGDSGIRKKVSPQLDGTFLTYQQNEKFVLVIRHDSLIIQYKTPYDQWEETVIKASETELVVVNKDRREYHYRPYQPLAVNE